MAAGVTGHLWSVAAAIALWESEELNQKRAAGYLVTFEKN
jgi:hypothetical protein